MQERSIDVAPYHSVHLLQAWQWSTLIWQLALRRTYAVPTGLPCVPPCDVRSVIDQRVWEQFRAQNCHRKVLKMRPSSQHGHQNCSQLIKVLQVLQAMQPPVTRLQAQQRMRVPRRLTRPQQGAMLSQRCGDYLMRKWHKVLLVHKKSAQMQLLPTRCAVWQRVPDQMQQTDPEALHVVQHAHHRPIDELIILRYSNEIPYA
mmetsp:Transcript_11397/g.21343  ORF Transcript_11397/g.21343 Transcript_11397/m.21343 type:complete len:202 (+) Transcript_11397:700-1305(+)